MEDRGLGQPLHLGRIYRIVPRDAKRIIPPDLEHASTSDLVDTLSHANGWLRDTAQRLLVERNDSKAIPALKQLCAKSDNPVARLHAFWTLEGLGAMNADVLQIGFKDAHPKVRAAAVRISESMVASNQSIRNTLMGMIADASAEVQIQLALTLGTAFGVPQTNELKSIRTNSPFALARETARFSLGEFDAPVRLKPKGGVAPLD